MKTYDECKREDAINWNHLQAVRKLRKRTLQGFTTLILGVVAFFYFNPFGLSVTDLHRVELSFGLITWACILYVTWPSKNVSEKQNNKQNK